MTVDPMPWFPCFPAKWLNALGAMKPDEAYVYWIVCLLIYDRGKPCADTLEALSRRTGLNRRRVSDALDRLFKSGKLVRQPDGIMNPFAEKVLTDQAAFRAGRASAGRAGASTRWGKTKQNQEQADGTAMPLPMANDGELQLEVQKEGKKERIEPTPKKPKGKHKLPADWVPGEPGYHYAELQGFSRLVAEQMFIAFRTHHIGRGNRWENWSMAWEQWCRNELNFKRPMNGHKTNGPSMYEIASGQGGNR